MKYLIATIFLLLSGSVFADVLNIDTLNAAYGVEDNFLRSASSDTTNSGNNTTWFSGFTAGNEIYNPILTFDTYFDSITVLAAGSTVTYDSIVVKLNTQQVTGAAGESGWLGLYSIDDPITTGIEGCNCSAPGAPSFKYRDSTVASGFVAWTTYGGDFTLEQDSVIKFTESSTSTDTVWGYNGEATLRDSAYGSFNYGIVSFKVAGSLADELHGGTKHGIALLLYDDTSATTDNRYVRFNSSESSIEERRVDVTAYYQLSAPPASNNLRRRRILNQLSAVD